MVAAEVSLTSTADRKQPSRERLRVWSAEENQLDTSCSPPVLVHRGQRFPLPPGLEPQVYEDIRASPYLDLDSPMTGYEWTKFVLTIPLLLIRICLVAALLPPVMLVTKLFVAGQQFNEPLPQWKARILQPFLRFWAELLLVLGLNYWHTVTGKEHIADANKARALLVINHVSYLDALIMGQIFMPCGLAKSAVRNVPVVGTLACALQFLLVERRGTEDVKVAHSQKGHITSLVHERARDPRFPLFMIGPEGTTKGAHVLLPFSTGAFVNGEPVLPVLLKYRSRHFNVGWGSIQSPAWHFLRVQAQFVNHLEVEILPVYRPSPAEAGNPRLYADNVRHLMAARLGCQLCEEGMEAHMRLKRAGIMVDWTGRRIIQRLRKPRCHQDGVQKKRE